MMDAGKWIAANLPGSITMVRRPSLLHFYSEEKAIQIPLASLKEIIRIMKYYGVTHLIPSGEARRALAPVVSGEVAGFKKVYQRDVEIYEVQYDQMPEYLRVNE